MVWRYSLTGQIQLCLEYAKSEMGFPNCLLDTNYFDFEKVQKCKNKAKYSLTDDLLTFFLNMRNIKIFKSIDYNAFLPVSVFLLWNSFGKL